jgi:hypothetical protein
MFFSFCIPFHLFFFCKYLSIITVRPVRICRLLCQKIKICLIEKQYKGHHISRHSISIMSKLKRTGNIIKQQSNSKYNTTQEPTPSIAPDIRTNPTIATAHDAALPPYVSINSKKVRIETMILRHHAKKIPLQSVQTISSHTLTI